MTLAPAEYIIIGIILLIIVVAIVVVVRLFRRGRP